MEDIAASKDLFIILWPAVAVAAVLCNLLVIHVVRVNPHMRTTTNYLIVNMATGDSIATIASSFGTLNFLVNGKGNIGNTFYEEYILCRGVYALYYVSMLCSIYSLVVITFDRFIAVTRPLKYKFLCSWTKYTIPIIWLTSLVIPANCVIKSIDYDLKDGLYYCSSKTSVPDAVSILTLGFVLPHVVILVLYVVIAYKLWKRNVPGEQAQETKGQSSSQRVAKKEALMKIPMVGAVGKLLKKVQRPNQRVAPLQDDTSTTENPN
ncbi:Substance-K receptor [Exaiptasia diaphana]|nr:Substance-K receptor [Exaiptasia diaphana]